MAYGAYAATLGIHPLLLGIILIWSLVWKGFALWKAGRLNQPIWFVALLVINTAGILEILYLFVFSEKLKKSTVKEREEKPIRKRRR